jgi:hypothetical protein
MQACVDDFEKIIDTTCAERTGGYAVIDINNMLSNLTFVRLENVYG